MLFHAGFATFSGGFVGVDIFFVISGYLITTILINDLALGRFSIVNFYERRARRILPAAFLIMLVCLPFSWFYLIPEEMRSFSQSLMAVSSFTSNILFWRTSGYFDTAAELKPLLHTWSLAVEEQYYLFFPMFLMLAWKLGKRWVVGLLFLVFFLSLIMAQWASIARPAAAFYLLPTRVWELLSGGLMAFYMSSQRNQPFNKTHRELGGMLGLVLIIYSVLFFDKRTPFPGLYALVPTLGAMLIILYASKENITGRLLGSRVATGIGLVSYSAYLWHQPLFAFTRNKLMDDLDQATAGLLIMASLFLACLSWRYVEQPFRNKSIVKKKVIFSASAIGTIFFLTVGFVGYKADGFKYRLPSNIVWQSLGEKLDKQGDICGPKLIKDVPDVSACEFGDTSSSKSVFLYGESHAQAISEELHKAFIAAKIKGVKIGIEGCEVVPAIHNMNDSANMKRVCEAPFKRMIDYIGKTKSDVIVISRWTFRLFPVMGEIEEMPSRNSEGGRERDAPYREYAALVNGRYEFGAEAKREALAFLMNGFLSTGGKVYLIQPVPEMSQDIARLNIKYYKENGLLLDNISVPHSDFQRRNKFVNDFFASYEGRENFVAIKPEFIFCDTYIKGRCAGQYKTVPFYYDDDHLSDVGAHLVVEQVVRNFSRSEVEQKTSNLAVSTSP